MLTSADCCWVEGTRYGITSCDFLLSFTNTKLFLLENCFGGLVCLLNFKLLCNKKIESRKMNFKLNLSGKPEYPEKNVSSKSENQHCTYDASLSLSGRRVLSPLYHSCSTVIIILFLHQTSNKWVFSVEYVTTSNVEVKSSFLIEYTTSQLSGDK